MMFAYRSADYHHQVLEISPPVSLEGETVTAFGLPCERERLLKLQALPRSVLKSRF